MRDWWKRYDGKNVGYIIAKKDKFTPYIATCSPDGEDDKADDCMLFVRGSGPKFDTAAEALNYFAMAPSGVELEEIFPQPIPPSGLGISFLIEPYMATHQVDPRHSVIVPSV